MVKFWQKRACNYANPFMRENTRGYRRKTVNLHVELVSDVAQSFTFVFTLSLFNIPLALGRGGFDFEPPIDSSHYFADNEY